MFSPQRASTPSLLAMKKLALYIFATSFFAQMASTTSLCSAASLPGEFDITENNSSYHTSQDSSAMRDPEDLDSSGSSASEATMLRRAADIGEPGDADAHPFDGATIQESQQAGAGIVVPGESSSSSDGSSVIYEGNREWTPATRQLRRHLEHTVRLLQQCLQQDMTHEEALQFAQLLRPLRHHMQQRLANRARSQ